MRWPWTKPPQEELARVAEQAANVAAERAAVAMVQRLLPLMNQPTSPQAEARFPLYALNNPWFYSTPQSPSRRLGSLINVDLLRQLADTYDIARSCIQHLKREVLSVPLQIVAKDDSQCGEPAKQRIKDAEAFFALNGGLGGYGKDRKEFEAAALDDLLIIGAASIYYHPTRGGQVYEVVAIDAATIRPVVDQYGWSPDDRDAAGQLPTLENGWRRRPTAPYEQWVMGTVVRDFTRQELEYRGLATHARTYTPYYASPIEWLALTFVTALKIDEWNRTWLTDGTSVDDKYSMPENWTAEQIIAYMDHLNQVTAGDAKSRHQTRLFPSGTQRLGSTARKDHDFEGLALWMLRRCCGCYGVQPASIGFTGEQYKVSQEESMGATTQFGAGVLLDWRKSLYDDLLVRLGYDDLETRNVLQAEEDATKVAERIERQIGSGQLTPNEGRQAQGKDPLPGGDVLLVKNSLVPLGRVVAGIDPEADPKDAEPCSHGQDAGGGAEPPEGELAAGTEPGDEAEERFARADVELHRGLQRYACVLAELGPADADTVRAWARERFAAADLAADGLEDRPHLTVRYGLEGDDPEAVAALLEGAPPLTVRIGELSLFRTAEFEVVKYAIDSPDLHALHERLGELPHTDTHSEYQPHLTLAYVQPGCGERYVGAGPLTGLTLTFDALVFSDRERQRTTLALAGANAARAEALRLWERKALNRLRERGKADCGFEHQALTGGLVAAVRAGLATCLTAEAVRAVFVRVFDEEQHPRGNPKNAGQFTV